MSRDGERAREREKEGRREGRKGANDLAGRREHPAEQETWM